MSCDKCIHIHDIKKLLMESLSRHATIKAFRQRDEIEA